MAAQLLGPRKQRTRQHVIADLSVHHVEGFILREAQTPCRLSPDYGYDLVLFTHDHQGYLEPGSVYIQLKAAESWQAVGEDYVFDMDVRDYHLWIREETPVILILFDASRTRAHWLHVQSYFAGTAARHPKKRGEDRARACADATGGESKNRCSVASTEATGTRLTERRGNVKRTDVTYGQLDQVLRSLGFSCRAVKGPPPARRYEHKATGAFITVPPYPDSDQVLEHHLVTARVTLDGYGIADATTFDARFPKAG